MSRARERRNLDLEEETKENEATLSQDDSTDIEGEEASMQRGKTSGVSRKSNLIALTGNPSKLGKKQQLSILLSLIHDIRLVYNAALKVPRKHINVPEGGDDPELLIKIFDEKFIPKYTPEQRETVATVTTVRLETSVKSGASHCSALSPV